eukprot:5409398-Ditylum_brightwellii.AAC.1
MNARDADMISSLPLTAKEKEKSHKRSEYYVHLMWFFKDVRYVGEEIQKNLLVCHGIWDAGVSTVSEDDSTRTPPTLSPQHILKLATRFWHSLGNDMKGARENRANMPNKRPVPGALIVLLVELLEIKWTSVSSQIIVNQQKDDMSILTCAGK